MDFLSTPEFWVAVSFFLFVAGVLYLGVHKKIATALDARAAAIAKEIEEAKHLRDEADKQGNAAKEAQDIVDLASREAQALAAETSRSMKEHFDRRMKLAEDKIGRAEAEALREVRAAAADAAVTAAQLIIADTLTPETADKLLKQGIDTLKTKLN
jgi:F-type H+-transporting ATPase subunit b